MQQDNKANMVPKWSCEEDQLLFELKQKQNLTSWQVIARSFNSLKKGPKKTGKQCRERYINYAQFGNQQQKNLQWTFSQEELLFKNYMLYGSKWVLIAVQMKGKSQNSLKNRFYNATGRMIRKIRKIQLLKKMKNKKPITNRRIMKAFQTLGCYLMKDQAKYSQNEVYKRNLGFFKMLSTNLIKLALDKGNEKAKQEDLFRIIQDIHKLFMIQKLIRVESSTKQLLNLITRKENQNQNYIENQIKTPIIFTDHLKNNNYLQANSQFSQFQQQNNCSLAERLGLLQESNQQKYNNNKQTYSNLEEELCRILNQEYIPQNFELIL